MKKSLIGSLLDDLTAFGIDNNQWTTAAQDKGETRKRAEQGRKCSWRNGSLQRKPELDDGMQ